MRYLVLFLFLASHLQFWLHSQELLDVRASNCDRSKRADILKDRIIDSSYEAGVFNLTVAFGANCSFSPKVQLSESNDTLYISLVHQTLIRAMCECCFESSYKIRMNSPPKVVMLKKNFMNSSAKFFKLETSDKWYCDFDVYHIKENFDEEKDSLYGYSFLIRSIQSKSCSRAEMILEQSDSILNDSSFNVNCIVSSCLELLPFIKTSVYNFNEEKALWSLITGKETNFDGEIKFHLDPGKKIFEFRGQEHKPLKDTVKIKSNTYYKLRVYLSEPTDYWEYSFYSKEKLDEECVKKVARQIFLSDGINPEILATYPFLR